MKVTEVEYITLWADDENIRTTNERTNLLQNV